MDGSANRIIGRRASNASMSVTADAGAPGSFPAWAASLPATTR